MTLGEYIDDNDKLLQVLGVFVALTVFSAALSHQPVFNLLLTGFFFTCTILIGLEARARLPKRRARSDRLRLFAYCFEYALALLVSYGVVWYHPLYRAVAGVVLAFVVFIGTFTALFELGPVARFLRHLVDPPQHHGPMLRRSIQAAAMVLLLAPLALLILLLAPVTPTLNAWLDGLQRLLGARG